MEKIDSKLLALWIESKRSSIKWKMSMGLLLESAGRAKLQVFDELVEIFQIKIEEKAKA
jgi:hypothetical protein